MDTSGQHIDVETGTVVIEAAAAPADILRPALGVAYLVLGLGVFSLQDVAVKMLAPLYPVWELVVARSVVALAVLVPILAWRGGRAAFRTRRPGLHLTRGLLALTSYSLYFVAIAAMPLAEVAALYAAAPLFLTVLSVPLLGEHVGVRRTVAVLVGLAGVLVMLRPGTEVFQPAGLLAVAAAFCYALSAALVRRAGQTESPLLLAATSSLVYLVGASVIAVVIGRLGSWDLSDPALGFVFRDWAVPEPAHAAIMVATGIISAGGFVCLTQAYRIAPVSVAAPFEYSYLLWALAFGYLFWGEVPGPVASLGAIIIVSSGLFVVMREVSLARVNRWVRRARTPVGGPPAAAR